ncbi:hypothetical protein EVAR_31180_1 [Eumeta japonica]|uniref:Uncharacterized protein n=1 Tax=Eumeta variegata TaxID=151549 RepID=A0A4C1VVN5_EUMVA|nr:hypothetical protein EVAR_31180_1 [Eumeta japonica]
MLFPYIYVTTLKVTCQRADPRDYSYRSSFWRRARTREDVPPLYAPRRSMEGGLYFKTDHPLIIKVQIRPHLEYYYHIWAGAPQCRAFGIIGDPVISD